MTIFNIRALAAVLLAVALPALADHRTIPAGTEVSIRTNETISSESTREGQSFSAVVERDVMGERSQVIIPRGSEAELVIRDYQTGGIANTGSKEVVLDLQSVNVGGRKYYVGATAAAASQKKGIGKNRRTAEMTGGGAALGAIIGAIAGGGKGAAIGAVTGAAAGAAAQVLTRGKEVRVPAESVLTFRLDNALDLHTR